MGIASYQHIFSDHSTAAAHAMLRDKTSTFNSNPASTPIDLFQHNGFREVYFKTIATFDRGPHEWKAGIDSDNIFLHEALNYLITDPTQFDPATPQSLRLLRFSAPTSSNPPSSRITIHLGNWTTSPPACAGITTSSSSIDTALEPRFAISHYLPIRRSRPHVSYDRVFQTPSFDNILLSSSTQIESLDPTTSFACPSSPPSATITKPACQQGRLRHQLRVDANYFRRFRLQLRRRRPDPQHHHQLPHRFSKSHHLRRRRQARSSRLARLLRLRQLLLRSRQCLDPGHRRPLPRRRRHRRRRPSSPATFPIPRISAIRSAAAFAISSIRASGSPLESNTTPASPSNSTATQPRSSPSTASRSSTHQLRSRPHPALHPSQRIRRRHPPSLRAIHHHPPGRWRKPLQHLRRPRFWRPLLRQCHWPSPQLFAPAHHQLLAQLPPAPHAPSSPRYAPFHITNS